MNTDKVKHEYRAFKVINGLATAQAQAAKDHEDINVWVSEHYLHLVSGIRIRTIRAALKPLRALGLLVSKENVKGMHYKLLPEWWLTPQGDSLVQLADGFDFAPMRDYQDAVRAMLLKLPFPGEKPTGPQFDPAHMARASQLADYERHLIYEDGVAIGIRGNVGPDDFGIGQVSASESPWD